MKRKSKVKRQKFMKNIALILILIFSIQIFAQSEFGSVNGEVTDPFGALIPEAKVKLIPIVDNKLFEEKSLITTTKNDGEFSFQNVQIGLYEVQIIVDWTEIVIKKRVNITSDKSLQTDLEFTRYVIEPCSDVSDTKDLTTDADKIEIITDILQSSAIVDKPKPILSTKNIKQEWLRAKDKQNFKLLPQTEIQYQADSKADFEYYKFSTFKVKGLCVEISFDYIWAVGKISQIIYMSGEGTTYEFRKVDGKWIKKRVFGWVS